MKRALALSIFVLAMSCLPTDRATGPTSRREPPYPAAPAPPPGVQVGGIAGFIVDESDQCIVGARAVMVDGPKAGVSVVQGLCDWWGYEDDNGFSFSVLLGTMWTIRATADGFEPNEIRRFARNPYSYTNMIVLKKKP